MQAEVLPAFVVRHMQGVSAFINRCAHRDLELDWSPGEFFDLESKWLKYVLVAIQIFAFQSLDIGLRAVKRGRGNQDDPRP